MENNEKENIKLKLASCLREILKRKKEIAISNKNTGIEDITLVETMRQLEAASGLSYTIIQTTSVGKRDIQFSTLITILDSLKISLTEFATLYDKVSHKDIQKTIEEITASKKTNIRKKSKRK